MRGMDGTARRERMRRLLERREREGLTYRELARRSGESAGTLSWWSHRLRHEGGRKRPNGFVELIPARSPRERGAEGFEIELLSGRRIRVGAEFEERALARLVALLEAGC